MINLLPPDEKSAITYARYNTRLRQWIVGALIGLVGVIAITFGGRSVLSQSIDSYDQAIENSKALLEQQDQKQTLAEVKSIQDNFKLVVDVLSREVLFSKLLPRVGQVMPSGTVLEGLSLNTENEQTAVDLTASAKDFISGSQIQVNLTDPANKLFDKADLVQVVCSSDPEEQTDYPCTVTMRVLPSDTSEFLLMDREANKK